MKKYKVTNYVYAKNKADANDSICADSRLWKEQKVKRIKPIGILDKNDYVDEPTPEPRLWVDAKDAYEKMEFGTNTWGYIKGVGVMTMFRGDGFWWTYGKDCRDENWDKAHQPTHIMLRIEGEKQPAPPEPTVYEQIKAICDGAITWEYKQAVISIKFLSVWLKAYNRLGMTKNTYRLLDETDSRVLCYFALQIAKEMESHDPATV